MKPHSFLRTVIADRSGAALAEFALILPALAALMFGIIEMGAMMWQITTAQLATKQALRVAVTRSLIAPSSIPDCGVATTQPSGTPCSQVAGSTFTIGTCNGAAPAPCNATAMAEVVAEVQRIMPRARPSEINVRLESAGLGFVGLGKPVPIVTVSLTGMTFDFVVLDTLLGLGNVSMPAASSSAPGEDMTGVGN